MKVEKNNKKNITNKQIGYDSWNLVQNEYYHAWTSVWNLVLIGEN